MTRSEFVTRHSSFVIRHYLLQIYRPLLKEALRSRQHHRHGPAAVFAGHDGVTLGADAIDEMLQLADIAPAETIRPAAEDGRDQAVVAVGAAELAPNTPQLARATATHSARKIPGRRLTASILAHPQTSIRQPTMS